MNRKRTQTHKKKIIKKKMESKVHKFRQPLS